MLPYNEDEPYNQNDAWAACCIGRHVIFTGDQSQGQKRRGCASATPGLGASTFLSGCGPVRRYT